MKNTRVLFTLLVLLSGAYASTQADSKLQINTLLQKHRAEHLSKQQRLHKLSAAFLKKPYRLGALGEGPNGQFDQHPLYRADSFDCVTYVSTVLALVNSNNIEQFETLIKNIRYKDGVTDFVHRNHFMSVDWNINNAHQGLIKDITYKVVDKNGKPVAKVANTIINKPGWYQHLSAKRIYHTATIDNNKREQLKQSLKGLSRKTQQEKAVLLYIPLNKLFDKKGQPDKDLFSQIPDSSIIEIVRPNWQIKKKVGTNMHVSHLGFALRTKQGLVFREASLTEKQVIDIPLADYLKKYLDSPTIKGINVQKIL